MVPFHLATKSFHGVMVIVLTSI